MIQICFLLFFCSTPIEQPTKQIDLTKHCFWVMWKTIINLFWRYNLSNYYTPWSSFRYSMMMMRIISVSDPEIFSSCIFSLEKLLFHSIQYHHHQVKAKRQKFFENSKRISRILFKILI